MDSPFRTLGKKVDDFVYTHAIQLLGNDPAAYLKLAARYEQLQWISEARQTFAKAIASNPNDISLMEAYAGFLYRQGDHVESERVCRLAIDREPQAHQAHFILGRLLMRVGKKTEALDCYRASLKFGLNDVAAIHVAAKAFADAESYEEAVRVYQDMIRVSPNNVAAYGVLASTYAKLQRFPEALEAYRQVVRLKPSADAYGILGSALAKMGRYREAVDAYQHALRLEPGLAQTYNRLSEIYVKLEDFEKQAQRWSISLDASVDSLPASDLALSYKKLKDEKEALESFKEAIRQTPNDIAAYRSIAQLYCKLQMPAKAVEYVKHALRIAPKDVELHTLYGVALAGVGKIDEAVKEWDQVVKVKPTDADALSHLAKACLRRGRYKQALDLAEKAVQSQPQTAALYADLGDIRRKMGNDYEAARAYWQAIHLRPQDPAPRYGLGLCYLKTGQKKHALEQHAVLKTLDTRLARDLYMAISNGR